jgi:hypothetical protein
MKRLFYMLRNSWQPYAPLRRKWEFLVFRYFHGRHLKGFKDIHRGDRCFLVGNGPSLKYHDLRKLCGEKTFVSNLFVLHESAYTIEPNYYCISCWTHWHGDRFTESLRRGLSKFGENTKVFLEYDARRVVSRTHGLNRRQVNYLFLNEKALVWEDQFGVDIQKPLCWGRTIMIDFVIPLACYRGFREIYIIGVDLEYDTNNAKSKDGSYFYDITEDDREVVFQTSIFKEETSEERIGQVIRAFSVVDRHLNNTEHRIYNAGHGGRLEVFPRVNYDDLF